MLSFKKLWASHPTVKGEQPLLDTKTYETNAPSTCMRRLNAPASTSRLSVASFPGRRTSRNTLFVPKSWPTGLRRPLVGCTGLRNSRGEAFDKIEGKRGIVFFQNYWGPGNQGDHIDLWNGSRLTDWSSGFVSTLVLARRSYTHLLTFPITPNPSQYGSGLSSNLWGEP